ncbi:phospholipid scramblase 2-like isoform X1 [Osmia bicornis bicornis]|uniref:phospholipid scramblase 2-like isoform X1 n=1 Tax=Osmia bicornis bicornis TaxID=1437191 RepID=UPI001EAF4098|nr:phospholipid scramblase 2-like isoform X1 [Osmia bicornis bicornis]XP_029045803.2 phospholipid scramblase 2-like isoform X1 [Osmia bicornis bicornis]XP_029045804.2 phospholipid scramblase 2-like isoform X1 [Osmia bicornis bicornis]XP_029045805.2 phospholipid scramblase 2-like isoform X1 [Osmia bicornis bicornis]
MDSMYPAPQSPYAPTMPVPTAPPPSVFSMPQPGIPIVPQGGWSPSNTTCPPGLEYLMALSHLFVQQKVELVEAFTGFETKNKYIVANVRGEPVYYVAEESGFCGRLCLGTYRSCEFVVIDNNRREVLRMVRPFRCDSCCCPCCMQELEVYSGDTLLGSITQDWSLWRPTFSIRNAAGNTVLIIKGPWLRSAVNVTFKVKSADGRHRVGDIKKEWSGIGKEVLTSADNFGISFPVDLDVKIKAVLLGACLLFDFMYFEKKDKSAA